MKAEQAARRSTIEVRTELLRSGRWYGPTLTASSTVYANNGLNQVTSLNVNGAGAVSVTYDANGNITNDTVRSVTYDAANRVTGGPSGSSLTYDPLGRLDELVGGYAGRYLYDGVETAGFGATGTTTLTNRFVRGPGVDEIVANFTGTTATPAQYWAADERGSLVNLTAGSTGATTVINTYDEYGVPASGNLGRLQYTGQLWLPDFGAYHYKARVYQPGLGRFLQTDPTGYEDSLNLYAYVGVDPINWVDPFGEERFTYRCVIGSRPITGPGLDVGVQLIWGDCSVDLPDTPTDLGEIEVVGRRGGGGGGNGDGAVPENTVWQCLNRTIRKNGVSLLADGAGLVLSVLPGGKLAVATASLGVAVVAGTNSALSRDAFGGVSAGVAYHVAAFGPAAAQLETTAITSTGWSAPFEVIHPLCWSADRNGWSQGWPGSVTSPKRSSPSCARSKC